jgi:excisionase family DNA binding protein
VIVEGVLISPRLAARYGRALKALAEAEFRRNGFGCVPDDLGEFLAELVERGDRYRADRPIGTSGTASGGTAGSVEPVDMSTDEAAGVLGVTPRAVRKAASSGRLAGRRTRTGWRFDAVDVDDYRRENPS